LLEKLWINSLYAMEEDKHNLLWRAACLLLSICLRGLCSLGTLWVKGHAEICAHAIQIPKIRATHILKCQIVRSHHTIEHLHWPRNLPSVHATRIQAKLSSSHMAQKKEDCDGNRVHDGLDCVWEDRRFDRLICWTCELLCWSNCERSGGSSKLWNEVNSDSKLAWVALVQKEWREALLYHARLFSSW